LLSINYILDVKVESFSFAQHKSNDILNNPYDFFYKKNVRLIS